MSPWLPVFEPIELMKLLPKFEINHDFSLRISNPREMTFLIYLHNSETTLRFIMTCSLKVHISKPSAPFDDTLFEGIWQWRSLNIWWIIQCSYWKTLFPGKKQSYESLLMYKYKWRVFKAIGTINKESQPSGREYFSRLWLTRG